MKIIILLIGIIIGGLAITQVDAQSFRTFVSEQLATDPTNGECLTTDGTNNIWSSSCGGGGSSKWESVGGFLQPIAAYVNDAIKATSFTASSTSATSTFPIIANNTFRANTSAGVDFDSSNGTHIANLGVGSSANSVFYGGVNIDGATRIATTINGVLTATAGVITASGTPYVTSIVATGTTATSTFAGGVSIASLTGFLKATTGAVGTALISLTSDISGVLGIANGGTATSTQTTNGVNYYNGTSITSGTGFTFNGTDTVTVNGATTNAAFNVKALASSNQAFQTQMTNTTDIAFSTYNTGDAFTRFSFLADGTMKWGGGVLTGDVGLNRSASGTLSLMPYGSASTGYLGIGTSTPPAPLSVVGDSLVTATSTVQSKLFVGTRGASIANSPWSSGTGLGNIVSSCENCGAATGNLLTIANFGTGPAGVNTFIARGTTASPTATQSGDDLYFMGGRGYGSSTWATGSKVSINMEASQTWTDAAQGTQISLETTPNNSTTRAARMTIANDGKVGIATTTPSQPLSVVGTTTMDRTEITSSLWLLGDYITNTLTWLDTKVEALTNVVLQGIWDFGGATSIEIVNGTAPTVDAIGEIAFDTTDNQLLIATSTVAGSPMVIPNTVSMGSFLIASTSMPFGGAGFVTGKAIPFKIQRDGYNVTEIHCDIDGGTSIVINFDNGTGNTSTVTCDTDGASLVGVGSNSLVTAGLMTTAIETGTVTGSPDYLRVSVFGTYTRE